MVQLCPPHNVNTHVVWLRSVLTRLLPEKSELADLGAGTGKGLGVVSSNPSSWEGCFQDTHTLLVPPCPKTDSYVLLG